MEAQWPRPGIAFRYDEREPPPPEVARLAGHPVMLDDAAPRVQQFGRGLPANAVNARVQPHPQPRDGQPAGAGPDEHRWEIVLLPPSATSVDVKIIEDTATTTVTNIFENTTSAKLRKAQYQFPLPHECSIVDFRCRIGADTLLEGVIKPRPEARRTFDGIVRRGGAAGLVEQCTPEIFKTSIGNIPAVTRVTVELSFIMLLGQAFIPAENVSSTTVSIPMYIAPRYGPAPVEILEAGPRGFDSTLSVQVEILTADEITEVTSDSHAISVERGVGQRLCQRWVDFMAAPAQDDRRAATVRLADGATYLDKDLVVCFKARTPAGPDAALACLEIHPTLDKHMALMITIPPKFMLQNLSANDYGEIVFLADRSGSMSDKLMGLKAAMEVFIRGMPQSRSFNIWCFGSGHTSLWPRSRPYSQQTMSEALTYVTDRFHSDMGGTELLPALQAIVAARERHLAVDIIVLTDGEVWRQDETISFVDASRRAGEGRLRFFALGIGNAVSHDLVEGIARAGGGYAEIIPPTRQDSWQSRMVAVLTAALTGHCGPIDVELDDASIRVGQGAEGGAPTVHRSPLDVSTLTPFVRNRIFYLFEGNPEEPPGSVRLKTQGVGGEAICVAVPVRRLQVRDVKMHRFAARSLLGDLERGRSWIQRRQDGARALVGNDWNDLVRKEGERLGCKWSLVSKWTSFVAVRAIADAIQARAQVRGPGDAGENELGLLRPRPRGQLQPAFRSLGMLPAGEDQEEDQETESESGSDQAVDDHLSSEGDDDGDDGSDDDADASGAPKSAGGPGHGSPRDGGSGRSRDRDGDGWSEAASGRGDRNSIQPLRQAYALQAPNYRARSLFLHPRSTDRANSSRSPFVHHGLADRASSPRITTTASELGTSPSSTVVLGVAASHSTAMGWGVDNSDLQELSAMGRHLSEPLALHGHPSSSTLMYSSISPIAESSVPDFPTYTPTFNPPSSTSMVQTQCETAPTETSRRAKEFVLRIVTFQQADGSFQFTNDLEMRKNMGGKVFQMLADFAGIRLVVAATALLAALLEALFQSFCDLWSLAVSKAKDFVRSSPTAASGERAAGAPWSFAPIDAAVQTLERAKVLMADLTVDDLNLDENGEPQPDQTEPVELFAAPVEARP